MSASIRGRSRSIPWGRPGHCCGFVIRWSRRAGMGIGVAPIWSDHSSHFSVGLQLFKRDGDGSDQVQPSPNRHCLPSEIPANVTDAINGQTKAGQAQFPSPR
jgi:hypothetical protein